MFSKAKRFEIKPEGAKASSAVKKTVLVTPGKVLKLVNHSEEKNVPNTAAFATKPPICFKTPSITPVAKAILAKPKAGKNVKIPMASLSNASSTSSVDQENEMKLSNIDTIKRDYESKLESLKSTIEDLEKNLGESDKTVSSLKDQLLISETKEQLINLSLSNDDQNEELNELKDENIFLISRIENLEEEIKEMRNEIHGKQMEMAALEDLIMIRDSLCKDLQDKLDMKENERMEVTQRLDLVKSHHALALQANESIRNEYKGELDSLKQKHDDERLHLLAKMTAEHETLKQKHKNQSETIKDEYKKQIEELKVAFGERTNEKEKLMEAKLYQLEERFREQIRLSEIQYEEESRCQRAHFKSQLDECQKIAEDEVVRSELEIKRLTESLEASEFRSRLLTNNIDSFRRANESYKQEIERLTEKINSNTGNGDFETLVAELRVKVDDARRDKHKYETALQVSREALEVLGARLLKSDLDVEQFDRELKHTLSAKIDLETQAAKLHEDISELTVERDEYRDALTNIINSKNMLDQAHCNIMTQNQTLMESLEEIEQNTRNDVEDFKEDLISNMGNLSTELLLQFAANQLSNFEERNVILEEQAKEGLCAIAELPALRKENEELLLTVSKQAAIIEKFKREMTEKDTAPKSPMSKKQHLGKENRSQLVNVSPLRERNY